MGKLKRFRKISNACMERARPIAARYKILVWIEDGEYYGRGVEIPNAYGDGKTPAQAFEATLECLVVAVACYLQDGEIPPLPAIQGKRNQQINVRFSAEEKVLLEAKASQRGSGLSDYIRAVALEK
jgi:predicted RNase H-like HicB family nuclease